MFDEIKAQRTIMNGSLQAYLLMTAYLALIPKNVKSSTV